MSRVKGYGILVLLFGSLFGCMTYLSGWKIALASFGAAFVIAGLVGLACFLISR